MISTIAQVSVAGAKASNVDTLLLSIMKNIVNPAIVVMFTFALLAFLWGMKDMVLAADNEEKRGAGQQHMLWGTLGMMIMMGAFGIIHLIVRTVGADAQQTIGGTKTNPYADIKSVIGNE